MPNVKEQLYILCSDYLKKQESDIRKVIAEAQEAANDETKSSAGDKYETGREVMQQEIDLNLARLNELNKMKQTFERIIPGQKNTSVQPGAVVRTNNGNYFISISAGLLKVDSINYYAISAASPIGTKLAGLSIGDNFQFNGKHFVIEGVA